MMVSSISGLYERAKGIQFARYFMVGVIATSADWSVFYMFAEVIGIHYQLSLIPSILAGSTTNYTLNKRFTFVCRSKKIARQFTTFFSIVLVCVLFSMVIMFALVELFALQKMISRIITTFVIFLFGYYFQKKITFNKRFFS